MSNPFIEFMQDDADQYLEPIAAFRPQPIRLSEHAPPVSDPSSYARMEERQGESGLSRVIDFLSRPLYAVTGAVDAILDPSYGEYSGQFAQVIGQAVDDFVGTEGAQKLTFGDIIKERNPQWAQENGWTAAVAGFAMDVAFDPLTYVGVGPATKLINSVGKGVTITKTSKFKKVYDSVVVDHAARMGKDVHEIRPIVDQGFAELLSPSRTRWNQKAAISEALDDVETVRAAGSFGDFQSLYPNVVNNGEHVLARSHQLPSHQVVERLKQSGHIGDDALGSEHLLNDMSKYRNMDKLKAADLGMEASELGKTGLYKSQVHNVGTQNYQDYVFMKHRTPQAALRFRVDDNGVRTFAGLVSNPAVKKGGIAKKKVLEMAYDDMGDEVFRALDTPSVTMTADEAAELVERSVELAMDTNKPVTMNALSTFSKGDLKKARSIAGERKEGWEKLRKAKQTIRRHVREAELDLEKIATNPKLSLGVGTKRLHFSQKLQDWARDLGVTASARSLGEVIASAPLLGEAVAIPLAVKQGLVAGFNKTGAIAQSVARRLPESVLEPVGGGEGFAQWYRKELDKAEAEMNYLRDSAVEDVSRLYDRSGGFDDVARKRMGDKMLAMDEAYLAKTEELGLKDMGDLPAQEIKKIREAFTMQLEPLEQDMIARLTNLRVQNANFTTSNNLLKTAIQVRPYMTGQGSKVLKPLEMVKTKQAIIRQAYSKSGNKNLHRNLHTEQRDILKSVQQMEDHGFRVERDAIALSLYNHQSAMRTQRLDELKAAIALKTGEDFASVATKISPEIGKDLEYLGGFAGFTDAHEDLGAVMDMMSSLQTYLFKVPATILKPAFSMKQLVGNGIQAISANGFGAYSVPGLMAASNFMFHGQTLKGTLKTVHGELIDDRALRGMLREFPVMKNVTVEGLGVGGHNVARHTADVMGELTNLGFKEKHRDGMKYMAHAATKYMNLPGHVEDFHRLGTFLSQVQKGIPPKQAFDQMEKALFNYTTGLSSFERKWMKNIMPFYQFTKFSTMLAKDVMQTPGSALAIHKSFDVFSESYRKVASALYDGNNEQLTDEERAVIPGFLLEQPRTFMGFDDKMRGVFSTFNAFNFLEVADMFTFKEDSLELDIETTLKKGVLAQLTPMIKVPLETTFQENLFTERAFYKDGHYVGDLDPQTFLATAGGAISARLSEGHLGATLGGGVFAKLATEALGREGAEGFLKFALGWEEAVDPRTGQRRVYVAPFRFNALAGVIPAMNDIVNTSRNDRSGRQKVLKMMLGVGTTSVDLLESDRYRRKKDKREFNKLKSSYKKLGESGRLGAAEAKRQELEDLLFNIMEYRKNVQRADIRGGE